MIDLNVFSVLGKASFEVLDATDNPSLVIHYKSSNGIISNVRCFMSEQELCDLRDLLSEKLPAEKPFGYTAEQAKSDHATIVKAMHTMPTLHPQTFNGL